MAAYPEWKEDCNREFQRLLSRHLSESDPSATFYEKLLAVPMSAWEDELPIMDACIRESQRMITTGIALRRNIREDMKIAGRVVKRGDFLAYPVSEVHLDPELYPEPHKYEPRRWLQPDPESKAIYQFLGWGAGRHYCPGVKVAKVEMKLIFAMFLTRYEFGLVDESGKFPNPLPIPNRNNIHLVCMGWENGYFTLF